MKKELPYSEEVCMVIIWKRDAVYGKKSTMADVTNSAHTDYGIDWKWQTVHTLLNRLIERGFLVSHKDERHTYYTPVKSLNSYRTEKLNALIKNLYFGDADALQQELSERSE